MQKRPIVSQKLQANITALLEDAEIYLDNHFLYNHASQDISETFRDKIQETQKSLSKSQSSEQDFRHFQMCSNQFSLFLMTQIKYPNDDHSDLIFKMRRLIDLLGSYSANCAPLAPKTAAPIKFFNHRIDDALDLEEERKPIREESFKHG